MTKYLVKRILLGLVILVGVSIIIFSLVRLMPADFIQQKYAAQIANGSLKQEDVDAMKKLYGLGDNSFKGIVSSYFNWAGNIIQGDFGRSFQYDSPVTEVIGKYMWTSFLLSFFALIFQVIISIPLGVVSATKQYGVTDYTVTVFAMMGIALPSFFFGALLLKVFSVDLGWLPMGGLVDANIIFQPGDFFGPLIDRTLHLILPMTVLVVLSIGGLMRYTRTNMLEVLNADFIRTARAKGLSEKTVVYKHAFRNTLIPVVTMLGGSLPGLFGGAMITESIFAIEGIGGIAYKAVAAADLPLIMGYNMFLAILTVAGTIIADIMYVIVDPRVKLGDV